MFKTFKCIAVPFFFSGIDPPTQNVAAQLIFTSDNKEQRFRNSAPRFLESPTVCYGDGVWKCIGSWEPLSLSLFLSLCHPFSLSLSLPPSLSLSLSLSHSLFLSLPLSVSHICIPLLSFVKPWTRTSSLETSMVRVPRKKRPSYKIVLLSLPPPLPPNFNVEVGVALKRVAIKNDHLC